MADNPYGTTLKLFDMDGIPVRKTDPNQVPEKLQPDGTWVPLYNTYRFSFATPVDEETFNQLVTEFTSQPESDTTEKAMGESSGPAGGYTVPPQTFEDL